MHQWLFVMMDAPYINRSIIEPSWKFEGRGLGYVLSLLWKGDSLDAGRVPVLTAFLFIGCCAALFQPQKSSFVKKSFWLCLLFLSLYAGHDVWGFLFKNLPLLGSLHTHRMSIGFQLFGLALIGTGVGAILRISQPRRVAHALAIILIAAAFWFPVKERTDLFLHARRLRTGAGEFVEKKGGWIEPLISRLVSDNTGIVYAGANHNWGKQVEQFGIPFHYFPTAAGLSTVGGALYHSLAMAGDTLFDFDVRKKSHFRLYGIASVIAPSSWQGLRGFEKQADFNGLSLWRTNYGPLHSGLKSFSLCGPRANAPQFMRHWVQSRLVERSEYGVLTLDDCAPGNSDSSDRTVPYSAPVPPGLRTEGTNNDRIEVLPPYRPWKIRGLVDLRTSRLVVAATGFHPGWKVSIDGQPGDTLWVTPGFTAAEVPTGKHEIDFEYQGSTLKVYLFLMSIGILVYVSQKNRFPLPPSVM